MRTNAETYTPGSDLGLKLVNRVTSIRSHSASRITWHSHDCFEMLLLLDGSTAYEFEDNSTVELPGGHFMVIPPGTTHRGLHDVRRPVNLTGIMFDPNIPGAGIHTPFTFTDLSWFASEFDLGARQARRMGAELRNQVKSMTQDFERLDLSKAPLIASVRLAVCSILLGAAKQLGSQRTFEPKQAVQSTVAFMKSHLGDPISIEEVAFAVHCSRAKLFEVFKDSTGMTPNDYWQRLRIDRAQHLLSGTDKSITGIAMECGFSTSQYFSSVFRKYAGVSPSDYRTAESGSPLPPGINNAAARPSARRCED